MFHVALLRPHHPNDDALFPNRTLADEYDVGAPEDAEWLVDDIIGHQWKSKKLFLQVRWNLGDTTWEPVGTCQELEALDRYLALKAVTDWQQLPRKAAAPRA